MIVLRWYVAFGMVHITELTSTVIHLELSCIKTVEENAHGVFLVFVVLKELFVFSTVAIVTGLRRMRIARFCIWWAERVVCVRYGCNCYRT